MTLSNENQVAIIVSPKPLYVQKFQAQQSSNLTLFTLTLTRHYPGPITGNSPSGLPSCNHKLARAPNLRVKLSAELAFKKIFQ